MEIRVDQESKTPIYRQVGEQIRQAVGRGLLPPGSQLPTVRALSAETGIAMGTVKHAYDWLERQGLLEKVQGRGSFVRHQALDRTGKKEQAIDKIDSLLDHLEQLGFTGQEIRIFLDLKMRERDQLWQDVRIGVVDCSPEALSVITGVLATIPHVAVYPYLLDPVLEDARPFDPDFDLLVTTATHLIQLKQKTVPGIAILPVVMAVAPATVMALARIRPEVRVGIVCASRRFCEVIQKTIVQYAVLERPPQTILLGEDGHDLARFAAGCDLLILPPNELTFCTPKEQSVLGPFIRDNRTIAYQYEMERGSLLFLEEEVRRRFESRRESR